MGNASVQKITGKDSHKNPDTSHTQKFENENCNVKVRKIKKQIKKQKKSWDSFFLQWKGVGNTQGDENFFLVTFTNSKKSDDWHQIIKQIKKKDCHLLAKML